MNDQDIKELNILSEKIKDNKASGQEKSKFFNLLNQALGELKKGLKEDLKK
ncbi:MAG TPA: hypothetical protein VIH31_01390 [Candidatus Paceibacterota bacterium]